MVALVKGPGVAAGAASSAPVHATDWLPSLVSLATGGADFTRWAPPGEPPYLRGDGLDVWASIASAGAAPSPRSWVLLETHPGSDAGVVHGNGIIQGDWKYVNLGPSTKKDEDGWWPPPGQDASAVPYSVRCAGSGGGPATGAAPQKECMAPGEGCLFNISADPCE